MSHHILHHFFENEIPSPYVLQKLEGVYRIECQDQNNAISIWYREEEIKIVWEQQQPIVTIDWIAIREVVITEDNNLQFILERMPSKMIEVQFAPYFAVQFGSYWEMCGDCEE